MLYQSALGHVSMYTVLGRVRVVSEMEACGHLSRGPKSTSWQSTGGGF
jgi:hypothetical protein